MRSVEMEAGESARSALRRNWRSGARRFQYTPHRGWVVGGLWLVVVVRGWHGAVLNYDAEALHQPPTIWVCILAAARHCRRRRSPPSASPSAAALPSAMAS